MYTSRDYDQIELVDFALPFGGHLDPNNRWVKLAKLMPWQEIEQIYAASMSTQTGRPAYPARLAFGAIFVKQMENLTDESCVQHIMENPYIQYFLGFKEFQTEPPFDSSMMVHFRKRFPVEMVAKVNEYICTGVWPEKMRQVDRNDEGDGNDYASGSLGGNASNDSDSNAIQEEPQPENNGTLLMDATVAPADIKYPTDIDLLNQCREHLETAIDLLWKQVPHNSHKLPYSAKKARKSYLKVSKSKRWTRTLLQKVIREQLNYIRLARRRLNQLILQVPAQDVTFPSWLWDRLSVIPRIYEQQQTMFLSGTHVCEDRIVSLSQPHVRPINRGKRPNPTEFGQKLHLSVVNGYTFLEQTCWNNYNEGSDLENTVQDYRRKFGCYPKAVLADKIYQTRKNRKFCKEHGIRLSGPPLGRRKNTVTDAAAEKQIYRDACARNAVEGRNGNLKRCHGLDLIMCKLDECAKTEAALDILAMNAAYRLRLWLIRFLVRIRIFAVFQ